MAKGEFSILNNLSDPASYVIFSETIAKLPKKNEKRAHRWQDHLDIPAIQPRPNSKPTHFGRVYK